MRFVSGALVMVVVGWLGLIPSTAAAASGPVRWIVACAFDHRAQDDPIVSPGKTAGHIHDFYGNTTTNRFSTYKSLLRGNTSCKLKEDKAAYWAPTLYHSSGGSWVAVRPDPAQFYYRARTSNLKSIRAFPPGLKIVAGNAAATGPQSTKIIYWNCENGGDDTHRSQPVDCGKGYVTGHIVFPDCWDGKHLDSKDHKSHMAYSFRVKGTRRFVCPKAHPVAVPQLIFKLRFPISGAGKLKLSSGPTYTLHGDFINSWVQSKLQELVANCLHAGKNCGNVKT